MFVGPVDAASSYIPCKVSFLELTLNILFRI